MNADGPARVAASARASHVRKDERQELLCGRVLAPCQWYRASAAGACGRGLGPPT